MYVSRILFSLRLIILAAIAAQVVIIVHWKPADFGDYLQLTGTIAIALGLLVVWLRTAPSDEMFLWSGIPLSWYYRCVFRNICKHNIRDGYDRSQGCDSTKYV